MQTIIVRYYGATNTKPACKRGWTSGNPQKRWRFVSDATAAQCAAVIAKELDWHGDYIGGSLDNDTDVFVCSTGLPAASPDYFTVAKRVR